MLDLHYYDEKPKIHLLRNPWHMSRLARICCCNYSQQRTSHSLESQAALHCESGCHPGGNTSRHCTSFALAGMGHLQRWNP